jgi:Ras-related protein Rab-35
MDKQYDMRFKVLIIGDSACGKTSTLIRYTHDMFSPTYITTIGIDFKIKHIMCNDKRIKLTIWDTAGQEKFRTITASYFKGSDALLVMYSIDNRDSFNNISYWISEINKNCQKPYFVLVANKIDLDQSLRTVSREEGIKLAKTYGIEYFEISAKKDINVNKPFEKICNELCLRHKLFERKEELYPTIIISKDLDKDLDRETKSSCCK